MISLCAPTADSDGYLIFKPGPDTSLDTPAARVTRTKTLDGGVYIDHSGVSNGDRTFIIVVPRVTDNQYQIIKRLQYNYTSITVACREGVFTGTIKRARMTGQDASLTILISEKLSE